MTRSIVKIPNDLIGVAGVHFIVIEINASWIDCVTHNSKHSRH